MRPLRQKDKRVSRWKNLICWILTILWMGMIFVFSAQNASDSSQLSGQTAFHAAFWFWPGFSELSTEAQAAWIESVQFWVRKAAHFLVYGGLGALLYGDFLLFHWSRPMKAGWAWVVGTLYAASDEIHQLFVPGRSGQLRDVLLDSAGVAAGILLAWAVGLLYQKAAAYAAARRDVKEGVSFEQCRLVGDWRGQPLSEARRIMRKESAGPKALFSFGFLHPDRRPGDACCGW